MDPDLELPSGLSRRRFLKLTALTGSTLAAGSLLGVLAPRRAMAQTIAGTVQFAIIGDFGETLQDQEFPVDQLGAMIRSWNPDYLVSVGDDNYILGEAATIDTNVGKNFTSYIYPKGTGYPEYYPYPAGAPAYNRFFSALGNHDYGDVADDFPPTTDKIALSSPYVNYFTNSLLGPQAPNTTINFANNPIGQSYDTDSDGYVCGSYAAFTEATNIRFYDVILGTAAGPSSVHLFVFDSNPSTPYGRYWKDQTVSNTGGTCTADVLATQGAWLQQRLAASTARWKIVIFHHPPYYSGTGASDLQYDIMRWPFQEWGASAVITGHVHNYERLLMPDSDASNQPDFTKPRIPYIVNGAGGFVPEQGFDPDFVIKGSIVRVQNYGAQLVSANDDSISFLFFDIDGVLRDTLTLWNNAADAPKDVQFGEQEFVFGSNLGTAPLAVVREGDLSQALSVSYTTMDGTAKQGVNYVAAAGTLVFTPGQASTTLPIQLIQPVYPPDTVVPVALAFSVLLSAPNDGTALGFFSSATVVLQNDVETPLNDLDSFIDQTYLDVLARPVTGTERTAARVWIGLGSTDPAVQDLAFLSYFRRAEWITNLLTTSFTGDPATNAPALNVGFIYALITLNTLLNSATPDAPSPPPYPTLSFGTTQWIAQAGTVPLDGLITQTSDAFNQNVINFLTNYLKTATTLPDLGGDPVVDDTAFILGVYYLFILPLGTDPTIKDLTYWLPIVGAPAGRYAFLGRIAVENFTPPPVAGMTAFNLAGTPADLTAGSQLLVLVAAFVAGLSRTEPTFNQLYYQVWWPIRYSSNVEIGLTDKIYNTLISPEYAGRFTVPPQPVTSSAPTPTPPPTPPLTSPGSGPQVTPGRTIGVKTGFAVLRGTHTGGGATIEFVVRGQPGTRTVIQARSQWMARIPKLPAKGTLVIRVLSKQGDVLARKTYSLRNFVRRRG